MSRTDEPIKKLFKNKEKESEELEIIQRHRDLLMQYEDHILQIVLGCEDQSSIDYAMPIRMMLYDAMAYTKQQNDLELKQNKEGNFYRGKMTRKQKVLPVLSVVFYYGEQEWTAGKSLHDVTQWSDTMNLKDVIPDYKMNLIWAYGMKDIDRFTSDLQYILYLLKYKQEEGGQIRMESKALKAIEARGEERGEERGVALALIMLVQKKIKKNKQFAQIVEEVEEDETIIKPIYHMIKEHPEKTTKEIYQLLNH